MKINRIVHTPSLAYYLYNTVSKLYFNYTCKLGDESIKVNSPDAYSINELKIAHKDYYSNDVLHVQKNHITVYDEAILNLVKGYITNYEIKMNVEITVDLHIANVEVLEGLNK